MPPSDHHTVRPLHLTLVSLATCLLPSVVLPLCHHYWAFLLSFGAVGFLTGQGVSFISYYLPFNSSTISLHCIAVLLPGLVVGCANPVLVDMMGLHCLSAAFSGVSGEPQPG